MARWIIKENDADIALMAKTLKISPILCEILANRGIRTKNTAIKYLHPNISFMHDIAAMADVEKACGIIREGIGKGQKFCIYGDYDVDGVSSTVILHKTLLKLGADSRYYIPHREKEGYGLNIAAIEKLAAEVDVLITVDNGIAAMAEVARAKELGLVVIIIDHHEPPYLEEGGERVEQLPPADAIIDPKRADCPYPFKEMSAAGIVYKFAKYLHEAFGMEFAEEPEFLTFAAIAAFCDVVDLIDENRIITANGLALLRQQAFGNIGLKALVKARNLEYNKMDAFDIGFIIGPCINATGRLESAEIAVGLFLCEDETEADALAARLVELNNERKELTAKFAEETIAKMADVEDKVLVVYQPNMHESIAGIVAGRVKDALNRPAIVFAKSGEIAKGSARSIEAYNIFEEMQKQKDLFIRFGGHKMAAGASLSIENIDALRQRLNETCTLIDEDFVPIIYIEKELALDDITYELAESLQTLAPFGKANKQPVFVTREVFTEGVEIIGQSGTTLRLGFRCESGWRLRAVAFKSVEKFQAMLAKSYSEEVCKGFAMGRIRNLAVKMDIAYHIEINTYNGNSSLQLRIVDFEF
ncbi:MAG: single-stranded-DNA-specific exonuclease RecJ [Defluviitaleaceae bacterium]|nr:single-stranded-DNA-specific exonuclease RecJ [Defluviitaleaceae bacterium]